jgi:hypothetical protein
MPNEIPIDHSLSCGVGAKDGTGPEQHLPTMPDPSRDRSGQGSDVPTMPDPLEDPARGQRLPTDPDPTTNKPPKINDPLPRDGENGEDVVPGTERIVA